jgi:hypothetical protein
LRIPINVHCITAYADGAGTNRFGVAFPEESVIWVLSQIPGRRRSDVCLSAVDLGDEQVMHMIRKGQLRTIVELRPAQQSYSLAE